MPYDPQRSHRRPQLADDSPAPIDALLDGVDDEVASESAPEVVEVVEVVDVITVDEDGTVVDEVMLIDEIEVAAATRGRPRLAVLAAALLVLLLVLAWVRRRR